MNLIIKLILEYQREKSDNVFEHLVFLLKDKIGYFLRNGFRTTTKTTSVRKC